ncbi:helix-turn-helix domain-containing protein [Spongiactinospora sp. 9N601]|uniref:helix-turn-helix domain-containing protein n=1 Tax=Spongiactinospora sp. 9N601 TaxID=3375149 RepID=UPI00378DA1AD
MELSAELAAFLRSRRDAILPQEAGVRPYGGRRRVPGLRREELAQIAGLSVAYYTRLEQGHGGNVSDAVLAAIARALRLNADERAHLFRISHPVRHALPPGPEHLPPGKRALIDAIEAVPAMIVGRRADVLAWNRLAHALLAWHLDFDRPYREDRRPNLSRMVFLDPAHRALYAAWPAKARDHAAFLRVVAGRYPNDPDLTRLIGELTMKSEEFAGLWAEHPVRTCASVTARFEHPRAGRMTLAEEVFELPEDPGQRLVMFTAEPGSPSAAAVRRLLP